MTLPAVAPFADWVAAMRETRIGDALWSVQAYQLASYAIACHTYDRQANAEFSKAPEFDQLSRAIGSVAANIAEGYSRSSVVDRNRFYDYALGSAREAITWYDTLRFALGSLTDDRQATLISVRRLLLTTLRTSRAESVRSAISDSTRPPLTRDD
jgi:four helix bundle protein